MRHVIVGGGIASIAAARSIRALDGEAEITLIAGEKTGPYYRPLISKVIETSDIDVGFNDNPIEAYGIRAVYDEADGIDTAGKEVRLESGGRAAYDKLLLATGSSAVFPPIAGLPGRDVFALRTLDDALRIRAAASTKKNAVVLGGGFVGIKASVSLKRLGLSVTLLEKLDRVLFEKLDRRGSAIVTDLLKRGDIDVVTNQDDYEIVRQGGALRSVRLASGRIINADIVIVAVGTRPNTCFFKDAGIRIGRGVLVGETLETSVPDIYAAGDVVEHRDMISQSSAVSAFWTNAEEMGRLAGKNMAGASARYSGFLSLMNTAEIMGVPITAVGLIDPQNNGYEVCIRDEGDSYRKLVFRNGALVGALFINSEEKTGIYTYLIRNRTPVARVKGLALQGKLGYLDLISASERSYA